MVHILVYQTQIYNDFDQMYLMTKVHDKSNLMLLLNISFVSGIRKEHDTCSNLKGNEYRICLPIFHSQKSTKHYYIESIIKCFQNAFIYLFI